MRHLGAFLVGNYKSNALNMGMILHLERALIKNRVQPCNFENQVEN